MNMKKWLYLIDVPVFSPKGFLIRAAILGAIFFLCYIAGLKEYTCILCGTSPTGNVADNWSSILGVVYVLCYFIFIVIVPVLIMASGILWLLQKLILRRGVKIRI
jgi:hypothetical protein